MIEKSASRVTTINQVYLIIAIFVGLIIILVSLTQIQMGALMAVRAYVGAEGLWAKAQKDATRSLEHYAISHSEEDYQSYLCYIRVPLGVSSSRIEMQKPNPNLEIVREGLIVGGNHPDDIEYMINLFMRFQHMPFMEKAVAHWTAADHFIEELNSEANKLHEDITSGNDSRKEPDALLRRLDVINQQLTEQENLFSRTLAES